MPIYEYKCRDCGHYHEALQKMADAVLTDCPECGKPALKRLLSAPQFRLKGGGWYETDFKTGQKRNLHGEQKSDAKADSKSDKKDKKEAKAGDQKKSDSGSAKGGSQSSNQSSKKSSD